MEKCFCHFNGYAVKDATARRDIETLNQKVNEMGENGADIPEVLLNSFDTLVTPQMFGAKADGVTDDSQAIIDAIASLPKENAVLYFPAGLYIHGDGTTTGESYPTINNDKGENVRPNVTSETADVGRDIRFYFDGFKNITIIGYGAEIRSNDGNGQTRNNAMFMFTNCEGVKIKGLTLNGRRQERGVFQDDWIPGPINEFLQCNITVAYNCRDILIEDVTSINSVHDGISIGWSVDNVKILNCVCNNAQRNGIAICGCKNVVIEGCQCNNNGSSEEGIYRGIAPKCGIDIEGHEISYPNMNIHVKNCTIENNDNLGFSIYKWNQNVTIEKCYIKNNPHLSVTDDGTSSDLYIRECTIINSRLYSGFNIIENNTIEQHYNLDGGFTNGYSFDDMDVNREKNPDAKHVYRNNTFKFIVDGVVEENLPDNAYMGIRLQKDVEFVGNRIIGAFSLGEMYPVMLQNALAKDNVFEQTYTSLNGIDLSSNRIYYTELYGNGNIRENNDFGSYYTYGRGHLNRSLKTDTTFEKSYSFNVNQTGRVYKVKDTALTKIKAFYLGQEEEVIFPSWAFTRIQHVLNLETTASELKNTKILTVYIDSSSAGSCIYIKFNVPYPNVTVTRYGDYWNKQPIFDELLTDVTSQYNAGSIQLLSSMSINMIRTYGNNTNRPTYGNITPGTMYFDTYIKRVIWWDGAKWVDKNGIDVTDSVAFTIDGNTYIGKRNSTFKEFVKTLNNELRLRLADTGSDPAIVTPDGNKTLYFMYNGSETVVRGNYAIHDAVAGSNPGVYYLKDTPGANPDYSKTPVFWNGTELVTATGYNGGGDEPGGDEPGGDEPGGDEPGGDTPGEDEVTITILDPFCPTDPQEFVFKARRGMSFRELINSEYNHEINGYDSYFDSGMGLGIMDEEGNEGEELYFNCKYMGPEDDRTHQLEPDYEYNTNTRIYEDMYLELLN